jgi:hypothetical protein
VAKPGKSANLSEGTTPHEWQIPCPARILPDFSQSRTDSGKLQQQRITAPDQENPRLARLPRETARDTCTNSGHPPVDWLHSIENTQVASRDF